MDFVFNFDFINVFKRYFYGVIADYLSVGNFRVPDVREKKINEILREHYRYYIMFF